MKTYAKSLMLLLLAMVLVLSFTACGKKKDDSGISGKTYAFESCTIDGEDMTADIAAMYTEQTFAFKEDGVCVQTIVWADEVAELMGSSDPVVQEGTYKEKGDKVTVTFSSDEEDLTMEFTLDGDKLVIKEEGSEMVYKLQG